MYIDFNTLIKKVQVGGGYSVPIPLERFAQAKMLRSKAMPFLPKLPGVNTHKASILYLLLRGNKIKNKEMWGHIDTGYSASRISELRADFWMIDDTSLREITKEKKTVVIKQYFIKTLHLSEILKDQTVLDFIARYETIHMKKAS